MPDQLAALTYKVIRVPLTRLVFDGAAHVAAGVDALERTLNDLADDWEIVAGGGSPGDAVILRRHPERNSPHRRTDAPREV